MKPEAVLYSVLLLLVAGCGGGDSGTNLADLPPDTGGMHSAHVSGSTAASYGYYAYTPGGYDTSASSYPLLVSLHGSSERGDSSADASQLNRVLNQGPPKLINANQWNPQYPMIVVSPQCTNWWEPQQLHEFITYVIGTYRVDRTRIYMTGLSLGGYGTYSYLSALRDSSYVAAAVPIAGEGSLSFARFISIPLWAFHGSADSKVSCLSDVKMVREINHYNPRVRAKITVYPGVEHDAWTRTYDGSGQGPGDPATDPFDQDIYSWMLQYTR